jgi:signal transduction histidine kinase
MSLEERDFERVLEHCVEITSSLDPGDVMGASVAAVGDLLPGTNVTLRLSDDGSEMPWRTKTPDDGGVRFETLLSVGGKVIGTLSVHAERLQPFTAAERSLVLSITPAIAAALNNAMVVERQRATWRRSRELDAQKATFVERVESDLRGPLQEMRELKDALGGPDGPETAEQLHLKARELARVVEQILDTSVPEGGEPAA